MVNARVSEPAPCSICMSPPFERCLNFSCFSRMIYSIGEIKRFVIRWRWRVPSTQCVVLSGFRFLLTAYSVYCFPLFIHPPRLFLNVRKSVCTRSSSWFRRYSELFSLTLAKRHASGSGCNILPVNDYLLWAPYRQHTCMFYRVWISGEWSTRELINEFSQRFVVWI